MARIDNLRYLAGRKKTADSLPIDVRMAYSNEYERICHEISTSMIEHLVDIVSAVDQSKNTELQNASGEVARAYVAMDIEAFITAVERFGSILHNSVYQLGFTETHDNACPWGGEQ